MQNMEDLLNEAIDTNEVDDASLNRVTQLARKQWSIQTELQRMEDALAAKKKELDEVRDKELPSLMAEIGMSEFKLDSGFKITVKDEVFASIPKDDPEPAFNWLRENNFDAIIKNQLTVDFGKGEDEEAHKAVEVLIDLGLRPSLKETVHPSTLKAFLKEQINKGEAVPLEKFGAFTVTRAKIEPPKVKK